MTTTPDYTAANIHILEPNEVASRFSWAKVAALAERYHRSPDWIGRGLEACRRAGVDGDYFIDRYLRRLPIARNDLVDEAMRELLIEARAEKAPRYS